MKNSIAIGMYILGFFSSAGCLACQKSELFDQDGLPRNPNLSWSVASFRGVTPGDSDGFKDEEWARKYSAQTQEAMHCTYDSIGNPSGAKEFVKQFGDQPDPDGLVLKAEALGYQRGIRFAQRCITRANALIAQQKKIAAEVGFLDKNVMYQAGAALVRCKQELADWSKMVKK